jgi:hypothetical protein
MDCAYVAFCHELREKWDTEHPVNEVELQLAGLTMVNGETEVNLILAGSALAGIINQLFFRIRRNIT